MTFEWRDGDYALSLDTAALHTLPTRNFRKILRMLRSDEDALQRLGVALEVATADAEDQTREAERVRGEYYVPLKTVKGKKDRDAARVRNNALNRSVRQARAAQRGYSSLINIFENYMEDLHK